MADARLIGIYYASLRKKNEVLAFLTSINFLRLSVVLALVGVGIMQSLGLVWEIAAQEMTTSSLRTPQGKPLAMGEKAPFWEPSWLDGGRPRDISPLFFWTLSQEKEHYSKGLGRQLLGLPNQCSKWPIHQTYFAIFRSMMIPKTPSLA
jgi:hypothetical protein